MKPFLSALFRILNFSYEYPPMLQISLRGSVQDLSREKCLLARRHWHGAQRWQPTCQPQMPGPGAASACESRLCRWQTPLTGRGAIMLLLTKKSPLSPEYNSSKAR